MEKKIYDLIVVGGGFTGVAAAISAARQGLEVLLVEKGNCFGGAAVQNLVSPFMCYWTEDPETKERIYLSNGIFREILDRLSEMDALTNSGTLFHEEYLKIVLQRMVLEANVKVLFLSYLTGVVQDGTTVKGIQVANKEGTQEYYGRYFIDATGDGDLAVLAGFPYQLGREADNLCQPMTLCFRVAGVDLEKFTANRDKINPLYQQFQREGKIKNVRENVLIFHNMVNGVLHFNSTRIVKKNPVKAFDKTQAELDAREQVVELFDFMKNNIEGFENAQLLSTAMEIGVRESRMILGDYVLTQEDLISCTKFEDGVVCANYDIDIHNPEGSGTSHYYFKPGEYYTVPYRCLCPKGSQNLLVAGRCISSTHEAQASYRIMPICCCLGEAAGAAAAICSKDNATVTKIDMPTYQSYLKEHGLII